MAPRSARMQAGSSRSPENPAPLPIRNDSRTRSRAASVALQAVDLREEQIFPRSGLRLDRADLVHEFRRLVDFLRRQSERVIRRIDHSENVVDAVLGVLGLLQIDLGRRPLVLVD